MNTTVNLPTLKVTRSKVSTATDKAATARLTIDVKTPNYREAAAYGDLITAIAKLANPNNSCVNPAEVSHWKDSGTITIDIECTDDAYIPAAKQTLRDALRK
jgi:hypothetical protein